MRTRDEHLAWCKERALEYVDNGELRNAVTSMSSDLSKHSQTASSSAYLMTLAIQYVINGDSAGLRRWIEGFQ